MRIACVNIDLDEIVHYARIHGLDETPLGPRPSVTRLAAERFGALLSKFGVRGTAFAIGEALSREEAGRALRALAEEGHEIGNHTLRHDYALVRRSEAEITEEVVRGAQAIRRATGRTPVGFRAPGYNVSATLFRVLAKEGYRYDSSVLPSAPYYLARAGVIALLRRLGRPSHSLPGSPSVLLAPRTPYRPGREAPYARGDSPLLELPISVSTLTGVPLIGTTISVLPWPVVRALLAELRLCAFVNLELHGVDLMDETDGIPPAVARRQRDLKIPASTKLRRLSAVLERLAGEFEVITLAEAAGRWPQDAGTARRPRAE